MDEKQFGQLLAAIEGLGDRLSSIENYMKENLMTKEEGMAVSETLEQIALETAASKAATAEDKAEAGYTILSSLFTGLENRLIDRFDSQDEQSKAIMARLDQQDELTRAVLENQQKIYELLSRMVEKDEQQDYRLWKLEKRLGG
jgi:hypothetical protein